MAMIRKAPHVRTTMLTQLGISITATVAATLILAGAQYELTALRPSAPVPDLTSGGKFAARVEALRAAADDAGPLMQAPPVPPVPLLAATNNLAVLPASFASAEPAMTNGAVELVKAPRHAARVDSRRRIPAEAAAPPKRSDAVLAMAAVAVPTTQSEESSVWATTKDVYKQALGIGGTVLDRVNPMNLIP